MYLQSRISDRLQRNRHATNHPKALSVEPLASQRIDDIHLQRFRQFDFS